MSPGPVARAPAGVREREDHDVVTLDLIRHREWKSIEDKDSTVASILATAARLRETSR
jgi:hypothetical protein